MLSRQSLAEKSLNTTKILNLEPNLKSDSLLQKVIFIKIRNHEIQVISRKLSFIKKSLMIVVNSRKAFNSVFQPESPKAALLILSFFLKMLIKEK